jgi:hypothetical protein
MKNIHEYWNFRFFFKKLMKNNVFQGGAKADRCDRSAFSG